jgi:predicted MFS family arabinose efflux permease
MHPAVDGLWLLAVVAGLGAAFTWRELRAAAPFLDPRVLAGNTPLLATYARTLLAATVSYTVIYGYTQWLESARGLSAGAAGLVLLPTFAAGIVVSALTGRRAAIRGKLVVGSLAQLTGAALLLTLTPGSSVGVLVAVALVFGIPQGLNNLALQNAVYHQADAPRLASSAGLMRTFMYLGAISAAAATSGFLGHGATTGGLHHLTVFLMGAAALFLLITLPDRSLSRPRPTAAISHATRAARGPVGMTDDDRASRGRRCGPAAGLPSRLCSIIHRTQAGGEP